MTPDRIIRAGGDTLRVRYRRGLDFTVGPDNPLINLIKRTGYLEGVALPRVDTVSVNDIMACRMFGWVHLLDVRADDPSSFMFEQYATSIVVEGGRDYTGCRIGDAGTRAMGELATSDYHRIKRDNLPELAHIDADLGDAQVRYGRLTLPLAGNGREVTHLLIGIARHALEIPARAA